MKVTSKSEYACLAMMELAANHQGGQPTRIKSIAESHNIQPRFLVQVLLQLKTHGLVRSVRGASGGYVLSRDPEQISLADILAAVDERDNVPLRRNKEKKEPSSTAVHVLRSVWKELQAEQQRFLANLSLVDLLRRAEPAADVTYQI
jgi:Rrf2 family protein